MKKSKLLSLLLALILITVGVFVSLSLRANAQEATGIIQYLDARFAQDGITAKEIKILSEVPLRLEITIETSSDVITTDELEKFHQADREVFVLARQHGFTVDSYVMILVNPQGKQLDYLDQDSKFKYLPIDTSLSSQSDTVTLSMATEQINTLIDKYNLQKLAITKMDISSSEGFQTLILELEAPSLQEANKGLALTRPMYPMLKEINAQGGQIAVYEVKIKDKDGKLLVYYYFDLQLMNESFRTDDSLNASGMFPEPGPAPAP